MVAASITMSNEQWSGCVEMRKQWKVGEDVEVGDGGDHEEVKGDKEMATAGNLHEEGAVQCDLPSLMHHSPYTFIICNINMCITMTILINVHN